MTEQEAIMIIQAIPEKIWNQMDKVEEEAIAVAIKALEELNLYKQNRLCLIPSNVYEKQCEELDKLKTKATPLKPLYSKYDDNGFDEIIPYKAVCPNCLHEFEFGYWNDEDNHHCRCGQKMDWEDIKNFAKLIEEDNEYFDRACEAYDKETGLCKLFNDYCDGCYRHCMEAYYGE